MTNLLKRLNLQPLNNLLSLNNRELFNNLQRGQLNSLAAHHFAIHRNHYNGGRAWLGLKLDLSYCKICNLSDEWARLYGATRDARSQLYCRLIRIYYLAY